MKGSKMTEQEYRQQLVDYSRLAISRKLSNATAGNISVRSGDGMLITPSGIDPDRMSPDQIVRVAFDGTASGDWKPSSEWALHAALYLARPEATAIVHAHPTYCVAISCLRAPIPPFHYMIASFGGNEVPCAPYAPFGSQALADAVAATMGQDYAACLMANHGMIALGRSLQTAFALTEKLEVLAHQYQLACSIGTPTLLNEDDMATVHRAYRSYGYGKPAAAR
ncbi:class II aldolase/adducin family protein [Sulfitobacter sp. LCG007]